MHIKQIIINGFKSYKEHTVIEPDKKHNVFVGPNGSGKSNFFCAIQFVLSDEYAHLKQEQRRSLLHESTGPPNTEAFVEIIFDNSDSRVPIEQNEIQLRRVIGIKKDQYYLNRKMVPRSEVLNLLESTGLSSSNTYYIVKQGTINQLATASDSYRLKVLREVAGTKVFDERKDESDSVLRETLLKLQNIDKLLNNLDERLDTLKEQKEELKEYQHFDKTRRALEFVIHEVQYNENKKKLDQLEVQRFESSIQQEKLEAELRKALDEIKDLKKVSKNTNNNLKLLKEEQLILNYNNQDLIKKKCKLELTIKDLSERNKLNQTAEEDLALLEQTIKDKETELEKVKPKYDSIKRQEEKYTRELALKEHKKNELYAKLGRCNLFNTKEERNEWINNEIKSLNQQLNEKERCRDKLDADSKKDEQEIVALTKKIDEKSKELETYKKNIDTLNARFIELQKSKIQDENIRSELWREENVLQQKFSTLKDKVSKGVARNQIQNGCYSVRKVLDSFVSRGGEEAKIAEQCYGTIIDNLGYGDDVSLAVEETAGNMLFYHIVENEKIASKILEELNRQKLPGEQHFMALNRLKVNNIIYPRDKEAIPMISKLTYNIKYDKAIKFIFGKTLICANMEVASRLARSSKLNCITLEGDRQSGRGVMTGGYFDPSKSRLKAYKTCTDLIHQLKQCEQELLAVNVKLDQLGTHINDTVTDVQNCETQKCTFKGNYDKTNGKLRLYLEKLSNIERFHQTNQQALYQCQLIVENLRSTKQALELELDQELLSQLPVRDQDTIKALDDDVQKLKKDNKEVLNARMALETKKLQLENLLTNNLKRRREGILKTLEKKSLQEIHCVNKKAELEEINKKIEENSVKLRNVDEDIEELTKKTKLEKTKLEENTRTINILEVKIAEEARLLAKFKMQQTLLEEKISKSESNIHKLGILPNDNLYKKCQKMSFKTLLAELANTNKEMKKFPHVNRKANDQLLSLLDRKEKLSHMKEKLIEENEEITGLISMIEQKKTEAIHFTFKQISVYFKDVFKKLVPAGSANLVMRTKSLVGESSQESDSSVDNFTGIGIKVSFKQDQDELKNIYQLSGGQKSLVALALIFAIQKCDPTPFYLFDEVDQALDVSYRRSVANMIHELSKDAQFITTTFRPELLEYADNFYKVTHSNKVSHIMQVTQEVARNFVKEVPKGKD